MFGSFAVYRWKSAWIALVACSLGGASSLFPIRNLAMIRHVLVQVGRIFSAIMFCLRADFVGVVV